MLSSKQPPFSVIEARISFTTRELGMLVIMKDNPEKRAVVVLPPPPPVIDFVFSAESSTEFRRRLCCCTLWVDFRRLSAVFLDFVAVEICFCGVKDTSIVLAVAWTDEVRRIRMFDAFAFLPNDLEARYFFLASFVPFNHALLRAFVSVDGSIVHWSARVARTVATFWTSGEVV